MEPNINLIFQYFPNLSEKQKKQFVELENIYKVWNDKVNVISRKDFDSFYIHHVLHSLSIAKLIDFKNGSKILDIGTGGGFPGIPLAIMFPDCSFFLCDSIGKKINVINEVIKHLELTNVKTYHQRAETLNIQVDFVISRAVTKMKDFIPLCRNKFLKINKNSLKNGILYLKGGDLKEELSEIHEYFKVYSLQDYFTQEFFETKKIVYVKINK